MSPSAPARDERTRRVFVRRLLAWGRTHRRDFPWRHTSDPFRLLIAEVLLQRSRGRTVAGVYGELLTRWPTAHHLATADQQAVRDVMRPLGLVRRADNLVRLGEAVTAQGMPRTAAGLRSLPGVGPYAAATAATLAWGQRHPVVDSVSARVYRRFFGLTHVEHKTIDEELLALVRWATPARAHRTWNWAVLDLADAVCMPTVPRCDSCPLADSCHWHQVNRDVSPR
jgi:A/G-specific adenine glycosylase